MTETKEIKVTIDTIKAGDKIRIERDVEVRSVNIWDGSFMTTDNRKIRIASGILPRFNAYRKDPVIQPQRGDVWRDDSGTEYHVTQGKHNYSSPLILDEYDNRVTLLNFKEKRGLKLVYRKGMSILSSGGISIDISKPVCSSRYE